jgi:hypothetical protein
MEDGLIWWVAASALLSTTKQGNWMIEGKLQGVEDVGRAF